MPPRSEAGVSPNETTANQQNSSANIINSNHLIMSNSNQTSLNPNGIQINNGLHQSPHSFVPPGATPNPYQTSMPYGQQPHWQGNAYRPQMTATSNPYTNPAAFGYQPSPHNRLPQPSNYNNQTYMNYPPVQNSQYNSTSMMPPPNNYHSKLSPNQMYPPRVTSQPMMPPGQHSYPHHPQYNNQSQQYSTPPQQPNAYNKMPYFNGFLPYSQQIQVSPGYATGYLPSTHPDYPIDNHHLSAAAMNSPQVPTSIHAQKLINNITNSEFSNNQPEVASNNFSNNQPNQEQNNAISNDLNSSLNKNSNSQQSPVNNNSNSAIIDEASQASSTSSSHNEVERTETPKSKQSHPTTPNPLGSPSNVSMSSLQDEYDNLSNPSWPRTPASPVVNIDHSKNKKGESLQKLYEMSDEPERKQFLDKLVQFNNENGITLNSCPHISKNLIDLYKLYSYVKERGGFADVTKKKLWKECANLIKMPIASTTSYTLRKQYIKHLLPFECKFDRNCIDPQKLLNSLESNSKKKNKNSSLSSPQPVDTNSQSSYPQATTPQLNSSNNQPMSKTQSPSFQNVQSNIQQQSNLNQQAYHQQQQQLPPNQQQIKDENYQRKMAYYDKDINKQIGLNSNLQSFHNLPPPLPNKSIDDKNSAYNYYPPNYDYRNAKGMLPMPPNAGVPQFSNQYAPRLPMSAQNYPAQAYPGQSTDNYQTLIRGPSQLAERLLKTPQANYQPINQNYPIQTNQQIKQQQSTVTNSSSYGSPKRHPDFNKFEHQSNGYSPTVVGQNYPNNYHSSTINHQPVTHSQYPQIKENYPNANEFLQNSFLNNYNKQPSSIHHHRPTTAFDQKSTVPQQHQPTQQPYISGPSPFPYPSQVTAAIAPVTIPQIISQPLAPVNQIREIQFPSESIEAVRPIFVKRKKLTSKDISQVDPWKLMMSLKSGLLAETTWALDVLSILLHDDSTYLYFGLQNLSGLLELLLEHFKLYLSEIFTDLFKDIELENKKNIKTEVDEPSFEETFIKQVLEANEKFKKKYNLQIETESDGVEQNGLDLSDKEDEIEKKKNKKFKRIKLNTLSYHLDHKQVILNKCENYTLKNRKGLPVYFVEDDENLFINDMTKKWDKLNQTLLKSDADHWKKKFFSSTDFIQRTFQPSDNNLKFFKKLKSSRNESINTCQIINQDDESRNVSDQNGISQTDNHSENQFENQFDNQSDNHFDNQEDDLKYPRFREKIKVKRFLEDHENEAYIRDSPPLCSLNDYRESIAQKCICFSTLIRNLSFVPGNEIELSKNTGLLLILGRLLLLHHRHLEKKSTNKMSSTNLEDSLFNEDSNEIMKDHLINDDESKNEEHIVQSESTDEWWWDALVYLRENALVTISNISGTLNLSKYSEEISLPIFSGLLHWTICPSAIALDNFKTSSISSISPSRLSLECLVKLSVLEDNTDLMLTTPPHNRDTTSIFETLVNHLRRNEDQTLREFALVLLYNFATADPNVARSIAVHTDAIQQLIVFIELAEHNAMNLINSHNFHSFKENPEQIGTTLDMIKRAALCLRCLARIAENRDLFFTYQQRLVQLVMSNVFDQKITRIIADVIYECSLGESLINLNSNDNGCTSNWEKESKKNDSDKKEEIIKKDDLVEEELKSIET